MLKWLGSEAIFGQKREFIQNKILKELQVDRIGVRVHQG